MSAFLGKIGMVPKVLLYNATFVKRILNLKSWEMFVVGSSVSDHPPFWNDSVQCFLTEFGIETDQFTTRDIFLEFCFIKCFINTQTNIRATNIRTLHACKLHGIPKCWLSPRHTAGIYPCVFLFADVLVYVAVVTILSRSSMKISKIQEQSSPSTQTLFVFITQSFLCAKHSRGNQKQSEELSRYDVWPRFKVKTEKRLESLF